MSGIHTKDSRKDKARARIRDAVRHKKITKPNHCEMCGKSIDDLSLLDGHHEDHTKPLQIKWLCRKCHAVTSSKYTEDILRDAMLKAASMIPKVSFLKMRSLTGIYPEVYKKRYGTWRNAKRYFGVM
jgi:hypothetical protein